MSHWLNFKIRKQNTYKQGNTKYFDIGLPPEDANSVSSYSMLDLKGLYIELIIEPGVINKTQTDILGENVTLNLGAGKSEFLKRVRHIASNFSQMKINNNEMPIRLFALAESPITETFTNEIDVNPLVKLFQMLPRVGKIIRSFQGVGNVTKTLKQNFSTKYIGQILGYLQKNLNMNDKQFQGLLHDIKDNKSLNNIISKAMGTLSGNRFDFFKRWVSSSFSGNYSFSIRLFNPKPYNDEFHNNLIIKPLLYLTALAAPQGQTAMGFDLGFFEPFYVKVTSPGLFSLDTAIIKSMSIVKGGSDNSIAMNNRPFLIEVRLEFESLLSTKILDDPSKNMSNRKDNSLKYWLTPMAKQYDQSGNLAPDSGLASNTNTANKNNGGINRNQSALDNIIDKLKQISTYI